MNRLRTLLLGLTVVLLAVSAIALLLRPSLESPDGAPVSPPTGVPMTSDSLMTRHVTAVVSGNLFDEDRVASSAR